jgi:hypothetical protein
MSDQPLFQNTDEQEDVYAPQQLPEGTAGSQAAEVDDQARDADTAVDGIGTPAAGAGLLSQTGGGFGGTAGVANPVGPAIAAATPDDETAGPPPDDD